MPQPPTMTWEEIRNMSETDGFRHWCNSVEATFEPRLETSRGEAPKLVPEGFLAQSIKTIRELCDKLDEERSP